jgi:hypothetical protein
MIYHTGSSEPIGYVKLVTAQIGFMSGMFRQNAQRCFEMARNVSVDARAAWLEMAQFWLQMAESRERMVSTPQQQQHPQSESQNEADENDACRIRSGGAGEDK